MPKAENSRVFNWTYAGRKLRNTLQWGNENGTFRMFALCSILPENDEDEIVRFTAYGFDATPNTLYVQMRIAENQAKAYIDALNPDLMDRFFKALGYSEAVKAQDTDDFWNFEEFDYVTGGKPRP